MWRRPGTGPSVASPPGHALFEHAALPARCLEPHPALRIVLSTSRVRVFRSVRKVARRLPLALRQRVVRATFHGRMDPVWFRSVPWGVQVWGDVCRRQPAAWLALDDGPRLAGRVPEPSGKDCSGAGDQRAGRV
ncbi:HAD domain-containing protein [Paraburkholderia sp. CI3]|uniref:HAD domain-containing protein n=1 Tax=Paraburkholderia sp. CI3 TaxID=2991060 RepID=UPI003D1C5DC0